MTFGPAPGFHVPSHGSHRRTRSESSAGGRRSVSGNSHVLRYVSKASGPCAAGSRKTAALNSSRPSVS